MYTQVSHSSGNGSSSAGNDSRTRASPCRPARWRHTSKQSQHKRVRRRASQAPIVHPGHPPAWNIVPSIVRTCGIPWPSPGAGGHSQGTHPLGQGSPIPWAVPWPRGRRPSPAEGMGPIPYVRGRRLHWPRGWGPCSRGWVPHALAQGMGPPRQGMARWCTGTQAEAYSAPGGALLFCYYEACATAQCTVHNTHTHTAPPALAPYVHASTASSALKGAHTAHRHRLVAAQPCQQRSGTLTSFAHCHYTCSTFWLSGAATALKAPVQHLLTCTQFAQLLVCND